MNTLFITLVRHAKSSWKNADQTDHDRRLSNRGERDALVMANRLLQRLCIPDLILCSSAVRTVQTANVFMEVLGLGADRLRIKQTLYLCTPDAILSQLASVEPGHKHVMVIGHNPGLEQLSLQLSRVCNPQMPTLGIRHFSCTSFSPAPLGKQFHPANAEVETAPRLSSNSMPAQKIKLVFEDFPKSDQ